MDSSLAEILGENEYELLSKQAKVSTFNFFHLPSLSKSLTRPIKTLFNLFHQITNIVKLDLSLIDA